MQTLYCKDKQSKLRKIEVEAGLYVLNDQKQLKRWLLDSKVFAVGAILSVVHEPVKPDEPVEISVTMVYDCDA